MATPMKPRKMATTATRKPTPKPKPKPKPKYDEKYWTNQINIANKKIKDRGLSKYKDAIGTKGFNDYWALKGRTKDIYRQLRRLRGEDPRIWNKEGT